MKGTILTALRRQSRLAEQGAEQMAGHPKKYSDVIVTFNDGEVKTYRMSAGAGICRYLATEAGQTGILTIWNDKKATSIPLSSIRNWEIWEDHEEPQPEEGGE